MNATATVSVSATRRFFWLLRRELWESRSIYIAPLAVAGLVLIGHAVSTIWLPAQFRAALARDPLHHQTLINQHYDFGAGLLMLTTLIVAIFYCLDALYGERRDRSILFWKSLPVSDLTTVLAKMSVPMVVLPLVTFIVTVVPQFIMAVISSVALAANGLSVGTYWSQLSLPHMWLLLLYHLFTVHALWWAPLFAYLLLVSAWARRAPVLWAVLPPLAIAVVERIAFGTSHFAAMLLHNVSGTNNRSVMLSSPGAMPIDPMTHLTPLRFITNPGLWMGLAVASLFLWATIRLRHRQSPV
jgi:ABC-2 type transport system permease protein